MHAGAGVFDESRIVARPSQHMVAGMGAEVVHRTASVARHRDLGRSARIDQKSDDWVPWVLTTRTVPGADSDGAGRASWHSDAGWDLWYGIKRDANEQITRS